MRARRGAANAAAGLILGLGLLALIVPAWFAAIVSAMQAPALLYLAAALRLFIGAAFLWAAPVSRASLPLFFLGVVMILGGIATPIIGQGLARPILDAWLEGGEWIMRGWGVAAAFLGSFSLWALRPRTVDA